MTQTTWQGFIEPASCGLIDDGLRIAFKNGSSALLPDSLPDLDYCRDLISRQRAHGLPVWLRMGGNTIDRARFARVATILQFAPEPLGGALLLFSDSPGGQYLPDTHPERERLLEVLARAFREGLPILYALEEDGLVADADLLPSPTEANGVRSGAALQQAPVQG
jgi:hypothetical protein